MIEWNALYLISWAASLSPMTPMKFGPFGCLAKVKDMGNKLEATQNALRDTICACEIDELNHDGPCPKKEALK